MSFGKKSHALPGARTRTRMRTGFSFIPSRAVVQVRALVGLAAFLHILEMQAVYSE